MESQRLLGKVEYHELPSSNTPHSLNSALQPVKYVPQRVVMCILLWLGLIIIYSVRVIMSISIIPMSHEFQWGHTTQGIVLSSFFWGYVWTQVPGGMLAKGLGGKVTFGFAIAGSCFCTILLPLLDFNFALLLCCRICTGLCSAFAYPTVHHIVSEWIPEKERSRAIGFIWSGGQLGTILSDVLGPVITRGWDWWAMFYITGVCGLIWFVIWVCLASSTPQTSRHITEEELYIIQRGISHSTDIPYQVTPWKLILTQPAVWAIIINGFCTSWGFYVLLMWMPTYLKKELHFDADYIIYLPYICLFVVSVSTGRIADFVLECGVNKTVVRKFAQCTGCLIPAVFLCVLAFERDRSAAVAFLVCAVASTGLQVGGAAANSLDIAPMHAGIILGLSNTASSIPGIVGVVLTGLLLDMTHSWSYVFWIASGVYALGALVWLIFSTGQRVI